MSASVGSPLGLPWLHKADDWALVCFGAADLLFVEWLVLHMKNPSGNKKVWTSEDEDLPYNHWIMLYYCYTPRLQVCQTWHLTGFSNDPVGKRIDCWASQHACSLRKAWTTWQQIWTKKNPQIYSFVMFQRDNIEVTVSKASKDLILVVFDQHWVEMPCHPVLNSSPWFKRDLYHWAIYN